MSIFDEIERLLGAAARTYAENKRRGGDNNENGHVFEHFHTVGEIARLAAEHLSEVENHRDVVLRSQVKGFVDDMEIEMGAVSVYAQIKDVAKLSWTTGNRPVADDFRLQQLWADRKGRKVELRLVVSNADVLEGLTRTQPSDLAQVILCCHPTGRVPHDIEEIPGLCDNLKVVCWPFVDQSSIRNASSFILSAWNHYGQTAKLADLLNFSSVQSEYVVRPLDVDFVLDREIHDILASASDFSFAVRGTTFAYWCFGGLMKGVTAFACGGVRWEKFEEDLRMLSEVSEHGPPLSFRDLLPLLVGQ